MFSPPNGPPQATTEPPPTSSQQVVCLKPYDIHTIIPRVACRACVCICYQVPFLFSHLVVVRITIGTIGSSSTQAHAHTKCCKDIGSRTCIYSCGLSWLALACHRECSPSSANFTTACEHACGWMTVSVRMCLTWSRAFGKGVCSRH